MRRPGRVKSGPANGRMNGAALIESLVSLSLSFFIVLACLEFLGIARTGFVRLRTTQETRNAARAGLDKMRTDIDDAGRGILEPVLMGIVDAIRVSDTRLTVSLAEEELRVARSLAAGETLIPADTSSWLKKGRDVCFFGPQGGETRTIEAVAPDSIRLSTPLVLSYPLGKARALVLKRIAFYLDETTGILRRKVNSSPAQPLVEDVSSFRFEYDSLPNRVLLFLTLKGEVGPFSELLFPKNLGLASRQ